MEQHVLLTNGKHPVEQGQYTLPTKEILRLLESIKQKVLEGVPGMIVYGRPRLGKSRAVSFIKDALPNELGGQIYVFIAVSKSYPTPNQDKFYKDLLFNFNFGFPPGKKSDDMRRQIVNLMHEKGERSPFRRVVLLIDEAQIMTEWQYNWLSDIFNELELVNISMTVICVGQIQLKNRRSFFLGKELAHIIGRFMTHEHQFYGIRNDKDMGYCLGSYDVRSEFPLNSDCSFTNYFFPAAFEEKKRLQNFAKDLYNSFKEIRQEFNLSVNNLEIPMEYFSHTVNYVLKKYGSKGDGIYWPTVNHWKEAISKSGYVESEIFMGIAVKES